MRYGISPGTCALFPTPAFWLRPWSASSRARMRAYTRPVASAESWSRCLIGGAPLPLEQHHAGRYADVQRCHLSRHRNAYQKIAALGHVFVEPAPFAAQHNRRRPGEFHLVVGHLAALVQAVNPVAT